MSREAPILHADAFFAAVEQRDEPALRGRPADLRHRFGPDAVRRPATLARERELSPWLRPGEGPGGARAS
ncbi:MAG: hypothetical protein FJW90_01025 [Actinobacteria bacterium]|nr:hypothetical protein [Actinomycetota bacterium]